MRPLILLAIVVAMAGGGIGAQAPDARAYLVAIDDMHLDFRQTPRTRKLLQDLTRLGRDGDTWALVTTGLSGIRLEPTRGVASLREAVSRVTGNSLKARELLDAFGDSERTTIVRRRASNADLVIAEAVTRIAQLDRGPLTVLYFTDGYDARLVPGMNEVVRATGAARGRLVAVSVPDLIPGREPPADVRPDEWTAYVDALRASLRNLAEQTGGIAVFSQGELDAALTR